MMPANPSCSSVRLGVADVDIDPLKVMYIESTEFIKGGGLPRLVG